MGAIVGFCIGVFVIFVSFMAGIVIGMACDEQDVQNFFNLRKEQEKIKLRFDFFLIFLYNYYRR